MNTLEDLNELSKQLDGWSDTLNQRIKAIEVNLRSAGVRCTAAVELPDGVYLTWTKRSTTWGLWLRYTGGDADEWDELTAGPRDLRVLALKAVPHLQEALVSRTKKLIAQMQSVVGDDSRA